MRAVDFKLNRILPENFRRERYDLGKSGIESLVTELARNAPDNYAEILHAIGTMGRNAAYTQGNTVTLRDSKPVLDTRRYYQLMDAEIDALTKELESGQITEAEFNRLRDDVYVKYSDEIGDVTLGNALKTGNNYAKAVASGARGKGQNLKALISTPGTYQDAKGNVIPLFVRNSFAEGVRPADSLAGSYGARASVTSTKKATAKGGDLLKLMTQAGANVTVTEKDCGVQNGIALDPDDQSIRRRVLAADAGDLKAGTVVDKRVAKQLRDRGEKVMVRSVNTCQSETGVCAKCAGLDAEGRFPKLGTSLGIIEASGVGEPLVQGALCLSGDTEVRMADLSVKKIVEIRVGDWVLGSDKNGYTFPVEVTDTFYRGEKEVYDWTFKMGQTKQYKSLVATKDHKILANTKKSGCKGAALNYKTQILPVGTKCRDFAAVLPEGMGYHQRGESHRLDYMLGLWVGDGVRMSEPKQQPVIISCADLQLANFIDTSYRAVGMRFKKRRRSHDWAFVNKNGGKRNEFKTLLSDLDYATKYCHEKRIHDKVKSWSRESKANFLAGYTDADGSAFLAGASTVGVSWSSTSRELLEDVKEMLELEFGIYAGPVHPGGKAGTGKRTHDLWSLAITLRTQVIKFRDLIGMRMNGKKRDTLYTCIDQANPSHYKDPFYRAKRVDSEYLGIQKTYDIEVNHPDHLFVLANGLIVSNSAKHTAGAAEGKKSYSGFDWVSQFMQVPKEFKDEAAIATEDGVVEKITEAPQGGYNIQINGKDIHVRHGFDLEVKTGQEVEAGDQLSDGLLNPSKVVKYKGLGAGRDYYINRLQKMLQDSGQKGDRRSIEVIAKSVLSTYRADDPDIDSDFLPDDIVWEGKINKRFRPADDTQAVTPKVGRGHYLQKPVLHYTVGSPVTKQMQKDLDEMGITEIEVSAKKPWFSGEMQRVRSAAHNNRDWMAALSTSYLKKQLEEGAHRGDVTNVESNTHYAPRLAKGDGFGQNIEQTGKF